MAYTTLGGYNKPIILKITVLYGAKTCFKHFVLKV